MNLTLHWINILILFGALNALVLAVVLLFQKKHPGSKFLAAFVLALAYNGFETFNWSSGLYLSMFELSGFIVIFATGPSLYLYIQSLLQPDKEISVRTILAHYAPVLFQFVTRILFIGYHVLWINKYIETDISSGQIWGYIFSMSEPASVIAFVAYSIMSILLFRKWKLNNQAKVTKEKQLLIKWVTALMVCISIVGITWIATVASPYLFEVPVDSHYYPIELVLVLFTYWMVLNGYHKVKLIVVKVPAITTEQHDKLKRQYDHIVRSMENGKLFLDPELNVAKLASHTGIPAKTISSILNQYKQTSFNDFINDFRVREVSEKMMSPASRQFTLSALALESGFNSQATFQRAFKNKTGMSPREYMNFHLKQAS